MWYASTSGLSLQERTISVMHPTLPKQVEYMSASLETWITEVRMIEHHGPYYVLPHGYKLSALKMIMDIVDETYEQILKLHESKEYKAEQLQSIIENIRYFVTNKRLYASLKR